MRRLGRRRRRRTRVTAPWPMAPRPRLVPALPALRPLTRGGLGSLTSPRGPASRKHSVTARPASESGRWAAHPCPCLSLSADAMQGVAHAPPSLTHCFFFVALSPTASAASLVPSISCINSFLVLNPEIVVRCSSPNIASARARAAGDATATASRCNHRGRYRWLPVRLGAAEPRLRAHHHRSGETRPRWSARRWQGA